MSGIQDLNNKKIGSDKLKPGMNLTAEEKISAIKGNVLIFEKLKPAAKDDISMVTEMEPVSMVETSPGSGVFVGTVGGNGFTVIPVGDTTIADLVQFEVEYESVGKNTKTDTIAAQHITIGKPYTFISKVFGSWRVTLTSTSRTVKAASIMGI